MSTTTGARAPFAYDFSEFDGSANSLSGKQFVLGAMVSHRPPYQVAQVRRFVPLAALPWGKRIALVKALLWPGSGGFELPQESAQQPPPAVAPVEVTPEFVAQVAAAVKQAHRRGLL